MRALQTATFDNGVEIELLTRDQLFLGLGEVRVAGTLLRSGRRPMSVEVRTPDGIELCDYQITRQNLSSHGVTLELSAHARANSTMEWMLHEVRARRNTSDWTRAPQLAPGTSLRLELRPVARRMGATNYVGFSYQYFYQSETLPIYQILDRATWEIGGSCLHNEFWMRNATAPPIMRFDSREQAYSTEWYLPSATNPNVFQFYPLQTELQGFTCTHSDAGTLLTWPTEVAHVRSLFEKKPDSEELEHWHEHCGDLTNQFQTSPVEVLWAPGAVNRTQRFNRYEEARAHVHGELHRQIGLRPERVSSYGVIEEWGRADIESYTRAALPALLEAGCETIYLANHFQNNMNVWGVPNTCCNVDFQFPSELRAPLQEFCAVAAQNGVRVEMWGNTAISTLSWIFDGHFTNPGASSRAERIRFLPREGSLMEVADRAREPWVRNVSGALEADHYTPVFVQINLRDAEMRDYWLQCWQSARDDVGLGGIFVDSSFNMSSDKFHFRANASDALTQGATMDQAHLLGNVRPRREPPQLIQSQYHAYLEVLVAMQRLGLGICGEDIGVIGVHRHGPSLAARLDNLPLWMDCLTEFDVPQLQKLNADADDIFFRGLAFRMMWMLFWDIPRGRLSFAYQGSGADWESPTAFHLALLKSYNRAQPLMGKRQIIEDAGEEAGVLYEHENSRVLWTLRDFSCSLERASCVEDLGSGETHMTSSLSALRHHVYLITPAQR